MALRLTCGTGSSLWAVFAAAASGAGLEARIDAILDGNAVAKRSFIGIHVVQLKTHRVLYERNADRFFLPASNMKLFTTALALEQLGADHRFITRLVTDDSGNLVFMGGGDPTLSGRQYPYKKDAGKGPPLGALEKLADDAVEQGLTRVDGDIVGDDTLYPWVPYPPTWSQDDQMDSDGAPVSALSLNDNVISFRVRGGEKPGDPVEIVPTPEVEYFTIDNRIATGEPKSTARIRVVRTGNSRGLEFSGMVPPGGVYSETIPVDDPALFSAIALYDALIRRGVEIRGAPVARHRAVGEEKIGVSGRLWAMRTSPPLPEILQMVDKVSQNLHAELMLREVGNVKGADGTREAGLKVMEGFMKTIGAAPDENRVDDGSGLSRNSQVTPKLVTRLLTRMAPNDVYLSLLPIGGEDGTLSHRLCCTAEAHTVLAKTGTLNRSVALSGYAESKTHGRLAFSIIVNNFPARTVDVQPWVDKIALALTE
jgi:D-alanyl-D-alanine carboxypeptidase/D-alanyl-D-alanine-endopeptidase (penicillin-binding protein 4)